MKYWSFIFLLFITLQATAQESALSYDGEAKRRFDESKSFQMLQVGLPLVAAGLAFEPSKEQFQQLRDSYATNAHTAVDDYLQYAPAALMLGLKGFGVESRSSWGRMLTSDALSIAIVTLSVYGVKNIANVKRPDSEATNSFPSGHTTTAFMTATMLHKEYGSLSPWISIAGYTAATATGVMRVVNNRHWVSDVFVGAGLGILSTELGYLLADLIFRDKGINIEDEYNAPSWFSMDRVSSLGLYLGVVKPIGMGGESIQISKGSKVGVEGSYFFGDYIGIGGDVSISNASIEEDGVALDQELDIISGRIGCHIAKALSRRWRVSTKLLSGVDYYKENILYGEGFGASLGTGLSLEYLSSQHFSMRAFGNYDVSYMSNRYRSALFGISGNIIF